MRGGKRCARCSAENDPGRVYCVQCGKFLPSRADSGGERTTVWTIPRQRQGASENNSRYVVICPQCGQAEEVLDGKLPFACGQCGYFFQMGIDRPVLEGSVPPGAGPGKQDSPPGAVKNPLAGRSADTSELTLIPVSRTWAMPERVGERGALIGADGTVLKGMAADQQLSIWHTPAGWYARALRGQPLYNGVPVNTGAQIRLGDGDLLTIGREHIRVEIV